MTQTVALFNHDYNQPLARMGSGLQLDIDENGLKYRFELGEQTYAKDLAINIREGIVATSSFGFTIEDDSWEKRDDGLNLRTINSVNVLYDVSPTTQGAYDTTEVGLRSMADALEVEEELEALEEERIAQQEVETPMAEEIEDPVDERQSESMYGDKEDEEDEDEEMKMQEEEEEEEKMQEEEEDEEEEEEDERNKENPEPEALNNNITN
jgi:HK97 family phage prohead protease